MHFYTASTSSLARSRGQQTTFAADGISRTLAALLSSAFSEVVAMRVFRVAAVAAATSAADRPWQNTAVERGVVMRLIFFDARSRPLRVSSLCCGSSSQRSYSFRVLHGFTFIWQLAV